ncbi:spermidine/putrescine ABC transporter ATP-binding protein [Lottiidibacillus patelloidae]|uniref:Spermidine/putrescine ABC transporter ATP-binding protein n=1 Tax=Lottiidibacillus patelloidae TaxID=2670334 RepID=A0A263BR09_9BACI|nr:ABC transporter ATP-binding protein [Lottiidibacillus patelloidae]OZM56140.1 spermidine/putrescine ABC transporter ATP-binding protein [Lottiidibacillus patelloidae]
MSFLQCKSVSHAYVSKHDTKLVLKEINLGIDEGEFISFIGPSGCGKTTLLSIISGLLNQTDGDVILENDVISKPNDKIGYMLQQDYLFPWKTIEENILIGLKIRNKLKEKNKQYALDLLKEMNLAEVINKYPGELSGGMRQRAALVRTLATKPKLLLLDEPFSALDFQTKLKLENLVFDTLKSRNKTAILVTHDIGEAIAMSDRIYCLSANPGKISSIFDIPKELRTLSPFEARHHKKYAELFQTVWQEMDRLEN